MPNFRGIMGSEDNDHLFPVECIIGRFLESAEMSESPCHAISVAFIIARMLGVSAYDASFMSLPTLGFSVMQSINVL